MDHLPLDLIDNILFRLDHISVIVMQCTDKFLRTYISDPKFDSYRFSLVGSSLFYISRHAPFYVTCQKNIISSYPCYILGSCSGLLLLDIGGCVFVANPFTNRSRPLDHSGSKILYDIVTCVKWVDKAMCVGFAVDRIQNQTKKRFKIVCIMEMQMMYGFEISDGHSWRLSETTITSSSKSDLAKRTKPVYLEGTLHWLRNDGSIIAFNPETEQACFIPSVFHQEPETELFFASDDKINRLTLVSGTKEEISVYTLAENAKWALARQIKNVFMEQCELEFWSLVMYDGKRLVVREKKRNLEGVFHVYDMEANNWGVLGSTFWSSKGVTDFYKLTPSLSFVEEDEVKDNIPCYDPQASYLTAVMRSTDSPLAFGGQLQNLKLEP